MRGMTKEIITSGTSVSRFLEHKRNFSFSIHGKTRDGGHVFDHAAGHTLIDNYQEQMGPGFRVTNAFVSEGAREYTAEGCKLLGLQKRVDNKRYKQDICAGRFL